MKKEKNKPVLPLLSPGASLIDTHCHLDMYSGEENIGTVVANAAASGISRIVTIGIDIASSRKAIALAAQYNSVYATVGIHPHNVAALHEETYEEIEKLCRQPRVVAYGEIGLDYVKEYAPKNTQLDHYAAQVDLAKNARLPLVIHDREAHNDILQILKNSAPFPDRGVMHCFSGDWDFAVKVLDLGFAISIPGVVTFGKAAMLQDVVRRIPLDRLILETDAPFLAPEPLRGRQNMPQYMLYTAQKVAELRGISLDETARATTANAIELFKLTAQ